MKHHKLVIQDRLITQDKDTLMYQKIDHPMFCVYHDRMTYPEQRQTFLEVFFTREAAEEWMENARPDLKDPWIYVKSGRNNPEWQQVRKILIGD